VTFGNGPVVGNIVLRHDAGMAIHGIPPMPMFVCGADSQGGLGFMLQQALQNALTEIGRNIPVASVITQVLVDQRDPSFSDPTKPIGPFFDEGQAQLLRDENGWTIVQDAGRGWRRVVPSPKPIQVIEWEAIHTLVKAGVLTIAAGGGGVPVIRNQAGLLEGVDAVIDKDRASALLGGLIRADVLVLVTQVDKVCVRFGKSGQKALDRLNVAEAESLLADGEFPSGSMGPKIEAAISFLAAGGKEAIITSTEHILGALSGVHGTRILPA
jgi:carbamate kinase